jgi:hypothetical protein
LVATVLPAASKNDNALGGLPATVGSVPRSQDTALRPTDPVSLTTGVSSAAVSTVALPSNPLALESGDSSTTGLTEDAYGDASTQDAGQLTIPGALRLQKRGGPRH